jgi:hypothetical protein
VDLEQIGEKNQLDNLIEDIQNTLPSPALPAPIKPKLDDPPPEQTLQAKITQVRFANGLNDQTIETVNLQGDDDGLYKCLPSGDHHL